MLAIMTSSAAIAVVPQRDAAVACRVLTNVLSRPLPDAEPAEISLVWRRASRNPLVAALAVAAGELWGGDGV
jgi:hypothetical protein